MAKKRPERPESDVAPAQSGHDFVIGETAKKGKKNDIDQQVDRFLKGFGDDYKRSIDNHDLKKANYA